MTAKTGGGGTVGSGWIGFSVAERPDAVHPTYLVPNAGMYPCPYQAQPERQGCVQASAPMSSYRFTQRPLQGLRDRPHRPDCLS